MPDTASVSPSGHGNSFPLLALLLALFLGPVPAWAEGEALTPEEEDERQEAIERHTERGWKAFRSGNHDEVLARMDRLEPYVPDGPLPEYLRARVDLRTGRYEEALARAMGAAETHPDHRGFEAVGFEAAFALGHIEEASRMARAALEGQPSDAMAWCALGLGLELRGQREDALEAYKKAIGTYRRASSPPEEIPWIARAAIRATQLSTDPADDLLGEAGKLMSGYLKAHPDDLDVLLMIADLYQSQRSPQSQSLADKYYRRLLEHNSEVAEARVGLARKALIFYRQDRAMEGLQRALQTNPRLVPALALLASIHIGDGDYGKAEELLARARDVNPVHKEARAVEAARLWIMGKKAEYEVLEKEAIAWDPTDGRFYVTISDLVGERQRRYDVAATFARKAIEADPNDSLAYVVLGKALMNLGRTDEAREQFDIAIGKSKNYKDAKRDNWLEVLDVLDDFRTVCSKHFVIRMHPSEADVLKYYLTPLLEDAWDTLSEKYGHVPGSPVYVDAFHRTDDFSVRSVGVKGLPALGVCFGGAITVLGPTARPVGSFSWARTAWHEFAHVVTLQLSKGQVPRWFTEALSVYEEKVRRANWSREMERVLYDRYMNDRLLRMEKINRAFRGPDIGFAYYQAGLIAEHIVATHGFEVIPEMLKGFARDRTTAEVFDDALDLELADYDRQFREFVKGIVGGYKMVPRWDDKSLRSFRARVKEDPNDAEAWARLGWAHLQRRRTIDAGAKLAKAKALAPDDPEVILLEGRLAELGRRADLATAAYERYLALGEDDFHVRGFLAEREITRGEDTSRAIEHLEAAKRCFPYRVGPKSPNVILAGLYGGAGEVEKAIAELEAYAEFAGEDYGVRGDLRAWYRERGDHEAVVRVCGEMVDINPFGAEQGAPPDLDLHEDYAEALLALGRRVEGVRELEVQVALLGSLEERVRLEAGAVGTHVRLGDLYLEEGRPFDALEQAIAALRLSPDDANARMLRARAEEAAGYR